jgi:K+-transporting ATPase ATPase C chain
MLQDLLISLRTTIVLWLLTAIVYPLLILTVGQVAFSHQANGSLIQNTEGQVVGSALIGQNFTSDRYFWGRPSAVNYSEDPEVATTGISGASNLAPGNPTLITRIEETVQHLQQANLTPTADLLYSSGSGLDPHISSESAQAQVERVAIARNLSSADLKKLIAKYTDRPFLGIFGEPGVNVLQLNLALDNL